MSLFYCPLMFAISLSCKEYCIINLKTVNLLKKRKYITYTLLFFQTQLYLTSIKLNVLFPFLVYFYNSLVNYKVLFKFEQKLCQLYSIIAKVKNSPCSNTFEKDFVCHYVHFYTQLFKYLNISPVPYILY